MQFFKNLTEKIGKKRVQSLFVLLFAGVLLLVLSAYFANAGGDETNNFSVQEIDFSDNNQASLASHQLSESLSSYLSQQLEEILSLVAGAGQVRVMLTMGSTASVYAQNSQTSLSATLEDDGEGGSRNIDSETSSHSYVTLRNADGSERPLRLQEIRAPIEGVIIVAEGAGDITVRDALIRAAATGLNIGLHQVQVFQMSMVY